MSSEEEEPYLDIEDDELPDVVQRFQEKKKEDPQTEMLILHGNDAKICRQYLKNHEKYKKTYVAHPRDYSQVNYKRSNTGIRGMTERSNGTFQCNLTVHGVKKVKTVKSFNEGVELLRKWAEEKIVV